MGVHSKEYRIQKNCHLFSPFHTEYIITLQSQVQGKSMLPSLTSLGSDRHRHVHM